MTIPTLNRDELADVAKAREGNLAETPFPVLLLALATAQRSLVLELQRGPLQKSIVFDEGSPVDVRSNVATETLGRFLVSSGKLSEDDYHSCLSTAAARELPFESVLAERGLLSGSDLFKVLQQNLARKLLDAFAWKSGTYRVSLNVPDVTAPLKVKVPQLLLTGITKLAQQQDIDEALAPQQGKILAMHPDPLFPMDEYRFTSDQNAVASALRHGALAHGIPQETGLPPEEVRRILYAFAILGISATTEQIAMYQARPRTAAAPQSTRASQLSAPTPQSFAIDAARDRDDLLQLYLTFKRREPHDLLGVGRDAPASMIRLAFMRFSEKWAPWRFDQGSDGLRDKAEEIFIAGARAFSSLTEPVKKEAVRPRTTTTQGETTQSITDRFKKADLLDPEAQYRQGKALFDGGKIREALSHFEFAADCDAQNATYAAEVANCRFQLMVSTGTQALAALKQAMRMDSQNGLAYLYAGRIHGALGNRAEAEAHLRRAAALMKFDKRPLEALKALGSR